MGGITSILQESYAGIKIIKAFGLKKYAIDRFKSPTWITTTKCQVHQVRIFGHSGFRTDYFIRHRSSGLLWRQPGLV